MTLQETILETIEYRLVLVQPETRKILALDSTGACHLPTVRVPPWTRPAEQLCKAAKNAWGLQIFVLDLLIDGTSSPNCAVAEVLFANRRTDLKAVRLDMIEDSKLNEEERVQVAKVLSDKTESPLSRVGWIDQAILWIETDTGKKLASRSGIEQYNAGFAFSLIRFRTEDDWHYWLKATGEPNAHEFAITRLLSELGGAYLPEMISSRSEWNAWLMSGETNPVTELPSNPLELFRLLGDAVESMAELQMRTHGRGVDLLKAGAYDQGIGVFRGHSEELFEYIGESMASQTSTKAARLDKTRLQEIRSIFEAVCCRVEELDFPETIVHGDMNGGNILTGCGHCQFIDWCEAYVGNPLITFQHLLLFNRIENPELKDFVTAVLKDRYRNVWLAACDPTAIDEGFLYMPMIAVASSLYGRGNWLDSSTRNASHRQKYARNLARHMDQAARDPELLEALGF
ncbi:aminoglycoside phosphotransferase family protein [Acidicapsa acidisoli]|uniref:aminoglycoside phosphotransferase family protein n=1 Tax=Acidicapsa acidisoli TaxID=1615681 RepID=UPI0021DF7FC8|nr:aminoglycoside phosphotransferase family protein [Acidicapsa acidisoli]